MSDKTPNPGAQHPPEWRQDLNPHPSAGQNNANTDTESIAQAKTAYDYKDLHEWLGQFTDDELKQIPVVPAGQRLEQGAHYFDLAQPQRGEFTATGSMDAEDHQCLVPKSMVDYVTWNRLRGVTDPARLDQANA